MKMAFFVDQVFWHDGERYSSDEAYTLFPISFSSAFDEIALIGRLAPEPGRQAYLLPPSTTSLCPLPYYRSVTEFWKSGPRLFGQIRRVIEAHAGDWDLVLVCGPNPVGRFIANLCIELGIPVALVVRQNLVPQVRYANRGAKQVLAVAMAMWLERGFKRLARNRTVFSVGQEATEAYQTVSDRVHNHFACLISDAQMAEFAAMTRTPDPDRLLFVGRLSSEKGLKYLLAALANLAQVGRRFSLDIVGTGRIESALAAEVVALGLENQVEFHGYVAHGEALWELYKRATAFVAPSLSGEGFPQVINESLAIGVPTIASTVGGIPAFLTHGETALLTPPADVAALAEAIEQLMEDPALQQRLTSNGQALMRHNTLEANRDRMIEVIHTEVLNGDHYAEAFCPA